MSYFQLGEIAVMSGKHKVIITSTPEGCDFLNFYTVKITDNPKYLVERLCTESELTKIFEKSTMSFQELMHSLSEA